MAAAPSATAQTPTDGLYCDASSTANLFGKLDASAVGVHSGLQEDIPQGPFRGSAISGSVDTGIMTAATVSKLVTDQSELVVSSFDLVGPCPEVTSIPGWTPPMTLQVLDVSELAPKEEAVIYKQHAQLFRWRQGEWKERGTGDAMLLRHKENGSMRFLMWQEKTYKTVANFNIVESSSHCHLRPHEDDPKTWEWSCQDHSDDRPNEERFAIHFKTEELAIKFKKAFVGASASTNGVEQVDGDDKLTAEVTSAVEYAGVSPSTEHGCNGGDEGCTPVVSEVAKANSGLLEGSASPSTCVIGENNGEGEDELVVNNLAALQL